MINNIARLCEVSNNQINIKENYRETWCDRERKSNSM